MHASVHVCSCRLLCKIASCLFSTTTVQCCTARCVYRALWSNHKCNPYPTTVYSDHLEIWSLRLHPDSIWPNPPAQNSKLLKLKHLHTKSIGYRNWKNVMLDKYCKWNSHQILQITLDLPTSISITRHFKISYYDSPIVQIPKATVWKKVIAHPAFS